MIEDGERYEVREKDVLILCQGNTHSAYQACRSETFFHWLHFDIPGPFEINAQLFDSSSQQLTIPVFQSLAPATAKSLCQSLSELETFTIDRYNKSNMMTKDNHVTNNLLRQQSLFFDALSRIAISESMTKSNQIAYSVMQYLHANYKQEITLDDLALFANCHPTHVIRCFNSEYHTTPIKMLTSLRLEQARKLLATSALPCSLIAQESGFSSSSYFSKAFTKEYGLSPRQFRESGSHR